MKPVMSSPRHHVEGYAVNVYADANVEIKLAQVYGATPDEATARAEIVADAFAKTRRPLFA